MSSETKLIKLQREMRELEKQEMKLRGSLDIVCKGLRKDLKDPNIKDNMINKEVNSKIKELKTKRKKAAKLLDEKMNQIEEMSAELEE